MTLLSVIIPAYNAEDTLSRSVKSVINQKYFEDLEIIIVNDGSTDKTKEMIMNLKAIYPEIATIEQSNQGLSAARNNGIKKAKGMYISFLDSDDEVNSDIYSKFYEAYLKYNMDMFIFKYNRIIGDRVIEMDGIDKVSYNSEEILKVVNENDGFDLLACNKIWKKTLLEDIQFPVGKLYEDMVPTTLGIIKSDLIVVRNINGLAYYENPKSITSQVFKDAHFDIVTECMRLMNIIKDKYPSLANIYVNRLLKSMVNIAIKTTETNDNEIIEKYYTKLLKVEDEYKKLLHNNKMIDKKFMVMWKLYRRSPKLFYKTYKLYIYLRRY